jgi:DNA-binding NarL/FixJ family response regulator
MDKNTITKAGLDWLTETEILIFYFILKRLKHREIAFKLSMPIKSVSSHLAKVYMKLAIEPRTNQKLREAWRDALKRQNTSFEGYEYD